MGRLVDVLTALALLGAGLVAGVIGTAGGITSLVAYPALLGVGIAPLAANVTSSVALLGSGAGAALRAGPEVAGQRHTLRRWLPPMVALSTLGALLLLSTPSRVFDRIVPFLVLVGSLVVLTQPLIAARWPGRRLGASTAAVSGGAVAVYNGYFGAGAGVLLIALLLTTGEPDVHRANATKNVLLVVADVLPAVLFAAAGTVVWSAVWPLGIGALVGGLLGPALARRAPPTAVRLLSASCGFVLVGWLLVR